MQIVKKLFEQTSWQLIGKFGTVTTTLLTLRLITSEYGEYGTGLYTLVLAFIGFFYLAVDLGLNGYFLPKLADTKVANQLFNARLLWSIYLIPLAILMAFVLPIGDLNFRYGVLLVAPSLIGYGIFNSVNLIFQQQLKYQLSITVTLISGLVSLMTVYILTLFNVEIVWLMLAGLISWIVNAGIGLYLSRPFYRFSLSLVKMRPLIVQHRSAWPLALALILNVVYFRIDTFILSAYYSLETVGVYNLAFQVFQNVIVIPTFIMNGYYPILLQTLATAKNVFWKQILFAGISLCLLGLAATVTLWLLAPIIISILAPTGFTDSTILLQILIIGLPAFFVSSLLMWVMVSLQRYRLVLVIFLIGLIFNLIANLLLIPQLSYFAAAIVTVLAEYLIVALQISIILLYLRRWI